MSRLDLVVGPNGAGKSTFVRLTIAPLWPTATFVNADVIAAARWPEDPLRHSYDAAIIAGEERSALIKQGQPLIAETVFSHPSKLDLIREAHSAGYYVALHVVMVPVDLAVARVEARVVAGGHDVPAEKTRQRFQRLWSLVVVAVELADTASFWDNSAIDGPQLVALYGSGQLIGHASWPVWTPATLTDRWARGSPVQP